MKFSQEQITFIGVAISAVVALFAIRYYAQNSGSGLGASPVVLPSSIGGNYVGYGLNQGGYGNNGLSASPGAELDSILQALQGLTAPQSTSTATPTSGVSSGGGGASGGNTTSGTTGSGTTGAGSTGSGTTGSGSTGSGSTGSSSTGSGSGSKPPPVVSTPSPTISGGGYSTHPGAGQGGSYGGIR